MLVCSRSYGGNVKLQKELVREILLKLEEDDGSPNAWKDIQVSGFTWEQVAYHICILSEGGLVEATDLTTTDGFDWRATRLTYAGHEFVDTVRDGEVWRKTKEVASKTGVYSLQVLMEAGKMVVKQQLMNHGIHLP
jgi:hypothetical protein